jgi:hypothetical protein
MTVFAGAVSVEQAIKPTSLVPTVRHKRPFGRRLYPRRASLRGACQKHFNNPLSAIRQTTRQLGPRRTRIVSGVVYVGTRCRVAQWKRWRVTRLRAGQAGQASETGPSILPLRYEYLLSVGFNTPRQMPLMTARARAFQNGNLFVTSVMPQLMSDLEKRLEDLGESRTQFAGSISIF